MAWSISRPQVGALASALNPDERDTMDFGGKVAVITRGPIEYGEYAAVRQVIAKNERAGEPVGWHRDIDVQWAASDEVDG